MEFTGFHCWDTETLHQGKTRVLAIWPCQSRTRLSTSEACLSGILSFAWRSSRRSVSCAVSVSLLACRAHALRGDPASSQIPSIASLSLTPERCRSLVSAVLRPGVTHQTTDKILRNSPLHVLSGALDENETLLLLIQSAREIATCP